MQNSTAEKIPVEENFDTESGVTFTKQEWKIFSQKIEDMYKSGKEVDFEKALYKAKNFSEINNSAE